MEDFNEKVGQGKREDFGMSEARVDKSVEKKYDDNKYLVPPSSKEARTLESSEGQLGNVGESFVEISYMTSRIESKMSAFLVFGSTSWFAFYKRVPGDRFSSYVRRGPGYR